MDPVCPRCGAPLSGAPESPESPCPSCGKSPAPPRSVARSAAEPIRAYFATVWKILTRPTEFFRTMPVQGGVAWPLAFALITHWMGQAIQFLWQAALGARLSGMFSPFFRLAGDVADVNHPGRGAAMLEMRDRIIHWIWGAGSVIADPFITLASLLITSLFVFIGARILVTPGKNGAPRTISFESALRIVCFATAPAILAALPLVGPVLGSFFAGLIAIIGAKNVYRVGWGRAFVVALFPKLLVVGIMFSGLFFIGLALIKLVTSMA